MDFKSRVNVQNNLVLSENLCAHGESKLLMLSTLLSHEGTDNEGWEPTAEGSKHSTVINISRGRGNQEAMVALGCKVGRSSQAIHLMRNSAMDDSIGGS